MNIPILAGGRMNDPDIAEAAIRDGKIDAVVMGRAALADPEYPNKVLTGHTEFWIAVDRQRNLKRIR